MRHIAQTDSWLDRWIGKNSWAILVMMITIAVWGATLASRVEAAEQKISKLEDLITRVVVLEEKDKGIAEALTEIKADIKEIKQAVK